MTRKKMVRKFIKSIRSDLGVYSKCIKKADFEGAKFIHGFILAKIDLALELGLIPTSDYYDYLMRIINLN